MLIATINPPAQIQRQEGAFSTPTTVNGPQMRIFAERYILGAERCRFQVSFGYLVPDGIDKFRLETIHRDSVELTSEDLADWGTDDSILFTKVANHFGISVVSVEEKDIINDF